MCVLAFECVCARVRRACGCVCVLGREGGKEGRRECCPQLIVMLSGAADTWEPEREALEHEVTYAAMPAGSVLISRGGILHGAGANVASGGAWRVGVFMSYTLGWLRQEENLYIDVPPELAIGFPADVRQILGCERAWLSVL